MKPALSVIFFTVSSGAGLGLLFWLATARLAHTAAPSAAWWWSFALAMVLVTAGLVSSTFHLANPRNAWRAFSRFATSWLSREGVFAVLLYPVAAGYAWATWQGLNGLARGLGLLTMLLALAILVSTAMIYACLKTIPRWNNWQTIAIYPLAGLLSGALILMAMIPGAGALVLRWIALAVLVAAFAVKLAYERAFAQPRGPGIEKALEQRHGKPRLLDSGHTHQTFLTREFGYELGDESAARLRLVAFVLAFGVPAVVILGLPSLSWVAAISCLAGLAVDRWLFFARARHVVRLYHGAQRV